MSRSACTAILGILIPLLSTPAVASDPSYVPGEILAAFHPTIDESQARWVTRSYGGEVVEWLPGRRLARIALTGAPAVEAAVSALSGDPSCRYAHPNYLGRGGEVIPDDTSFGSQWHLVNTGQSGGLLDADIDAESGWSISRGSASVVVAVLDTGLDSDHPEFDGRVTPGFDFVGDDTDPEDDHGHGTMASGILAANANNDFAVAGVDHFCTIMPIKILNQDNLGSTFDLVQGIDFAVTQGVEVMSMSLIGYPDALAIRNALRDASEAGVVLVACGGNDGLGDADVSWPGASEYTISVGWTDDLDVRDDDSGTGMALDVVAPGAGVITVRYDSSADLTTSFSGCSAATPVVAGIASLCLAVDSELATASVRALIIAGSEDEVGPPEEDGPGWDPYYGYGRVNLEETLALAAVATAVDPVGGASVVAPARAVPNPFRTLTRLLIPDALPGPVDVHIVAADGREVRELHTFASAPIVWDGTTDLGGAAAPGRYFWSATDAAGVIGRGSVVLLP